MKKVMLFYYMAKKRNAHEQMMEKTERELFSSWSRLFSWIRISSCVLPLIISLSTIYLNFPSWTSFSFDWFAKINIIQLIFYIQPNVILHQNQQCVHSFFIHILLVWIETTLKLIKYKLTNWLIYSSDLELR